MGACRAGCDSMERSEKGDGAETRRDGSRRGQMHLLGTSSSWATLLIAGRTLSQVRPRTLPSPHDATPPPNCVELCHLLSTQGSERCSVLAAVPASVLSKDMVLRTQRVKPSDAL